MGITHDEGLEEEDQKDVEERLILELHINRKKREFRKKIIFPELQIKLHTFNAYAFLSVNNKVTPFSPPIPICPCTWEKYGCVLLRTNLPSVSLQSIESAFIAA